MSEALAIELGLEVAWVQKPHSGKDCPAMAQGHGLISGSILWDSVLTLSRLAWGREAGRWRGGVPRRDGQEQFGHLRAPYTLFFFFFNKLSLSPFFFKLLS